MSHRKGSVRFWPGCVNGEGFNLAPLAPRYASDMAKLYGDINAEDLASNGLDPRLAEAYQDEPHARERLQALRASVRSERPIGAFGIFEGIRLIDDDPDEARELHGTVMFAREAEARVERMRSRLLGKREGGTRLFTSWLRTETSRHIDPDKVMEQSLFVAAHAGLQSLRIAVLEDLKDASRKLTLVEHVIYPRHHGFVRIGERAVEVEGRRYGSTVYQHDF